MSASSPDHFYNREEAQDHLRSVGFHIHNAVTKKVSVLFVGPEWGRRKMERAMKYGTPIIPYPFPWAIGYFDRRLGNGYPSKPLSALCLEVLTLADILHAHYLNTNDERIQLGLQCLVGVLQRLLLISGGPSIELDAERDEDAPKLDAEDLETLLAEIQQGWDLAIGFVEAAV